MICKTQDSQHWMHLQPWRFSWLNLFWLIPLSYGVFSYQGPSAYLIYIGYTWIFILLITYIVWQVNAYIKAPKIMLKILKKISISVAPPIYIILNLSQASLKINTHFTEVIDEPDSNIRWYKANDAEFIELSPHAIVTLQNQKKLLALILRHIAKIRFCGIVIQISNETLLHQPAFKTIRTIMQYIERLGYKKSLFYQIIIYNNKADNQDAVIIRPEHNYQNHPNLWPALRNSFQAIIDDIRGHTIITEPTCLDLLMDPIEELLASIAAKTTFSCQAIHLIGFSVSKLINSDNPLLTPYKQRYWPNILSKSSIILILLACALVIKEHYEINVRINSEYEKLKNSNHDIVIKQLIGHSIATNEKLRDHFNIDPNKLSKEQLQAAYKILSKIPEEEQIHSLSSYIVIPEEFSTTKSLKEFYEQAANLYCQIKDDNNTSCPIRATTIFIHLWAINQLDLLENSLLPIDIQNPIEQSVRTNQLRYILSHPEIIGEHVHQRLDLIGSILKIYTKEEIKNRQEEISELVDNFKNSSTYKAIDILVSEESDGLDLIPLNSIDKKITDTILKLENQNDTSQLSDLEKDWQILYQNAINLEECFPIKQSSSTDCDVHKFIAFFKPQGAFDTFWDKHLQPLTLLNTDGSISLDDAEENINLEVLDRYMQVKIIQSIFFKSLSPEFSIRIRPEISKELQAVLTLSNNKYKINSQMHEEININWNYLNDTNAEIAITSKDQEKLLEYHGNWAILRFIQENIHNKNKSYYLELDINNEFLKLGLISSTSMNPWQTDLYENFSIPKNISYDQQKLIFNNEIDVIEEN